MLPTRIYLGSSLTKSWTLTVDIVLMIGIINTIIYYDILRGYLYARQFFDKCGYIITEYLLLF